MIDLLPAASLLNEARLNDPEEAAYYANLPDPENKESWHPRLSEYKLDHMMYRELLGAINSLERTLVGVNGGTPHPTKPFPVPYTEVDRLRDAADKQFIIDIAGLFGFGPEDLF